MISTGKLLDKDFSWFDAVRWTDNALGLHTFDNSCRPVITDLHIALNEGNGCLSEIRHEFDGFVILFINGLGTPCVLRRFRLEFVDRFIKGGLALFLDEIHDPRNLFIRDVRTVYPGEFGGSRGNEEHVAVAQQGFRTELVEDGPRIHLGGDEEGYPGREVCLDDTRDNVD